MNREAYNEAWRQLLTARRLGDLTEIHQCAEKLAYEARMLVLDMAQTTTKIPPEVCAHEVLVNGYCLACGEDVASDFIGDAVKETSQRRLNPPELPQT